MQEVETLSPLLPHLARHPLVQMAAEEVEALALLPAVAEMCLVRMQSEAVLGRPGADQRQRGFDLGTAGVTGYGRDDEIWGGQTPDEFSRWAAELRDDWATRDAEKKARAASSPAAAKNMPTYANDMVCRSEM